MGLVERLRLYLERLPEPWPEPLDLAPYRAHAIGRLREIEQAEPGEALRLHGQVRDQLEDFVIRARNQLARNFALSEHSEDAKTWMFVALDAWLGLPINTGSAVVDAAIHDVQRRGGAGGAERDPIDVRRHAFEVRLTRRRDRDVALTRAGRVFLSLPGRDAVAWLLALEMEQAQSEKDPHRLSASAAREVLARGHWWDRYAGSSSPEEPPPATPASLRRLEDLGVIQVTYDTYWGEVVGEDSTVTPEGRLILEDLLREGESRWKPLAAACIAEERGALLDDLLPAAQRLQLESAAEASAREARLVAHEVRNALGPVRFGLNRLVAVVEDADAKRQLSRVEEGVTRLFRFVEDRLRVAQAIEQSGESFEIDAAVRDAATQDNPPDLALGAADVAVRGPRSSVTVALVELVRNAHLANGAGTVRVRITTERRNGHVWVMIDDDGGGVPLQDRERIFQRGVSLRGGGGEGLALTKDVFERAMGGTIKCMESPFGGARFEIVLPVILPLPRPNR